MGKFFSNAHIGQQNRDLIKAMINLALEDYDVIETRTHRDKELPSIMIDREYENCAYEVQTVADKQFGFCIKWNCRIYWLAQLRKEAGI